MNEQNGILINELGEYIAFITEKNRYLKEDNIVVPLSNYYDVFNIEKYQEAKWDFSIKKWIGVGQKNVQQFLNNEDNEVEELKKRLKLAEKKIEELTQSIKK